MNLILFEESELGTKLPFSDPRSRHIRDILKLKVGDNFLAGIIDGPIGRASLVSADDGAWIVDFVAEKESPSLENLVVILGCPRPPVARRILKDLTSLGICEIRVCGTDLNEKSYLTSKLWRDGLWYSAIIDGAMQAACSVIPKVVVFESLETALDDLPHGADWVCMDNGDDALPFTDWKPRSELAVMAVGPERGWSDTEREMFKLRGFARVVLGRRILRTETACAVGSALILDRLKLSNEPIALTYRTKR